MTLKFRDPPAGGSFHCNFLLYGPPKTGKTAGAASAPGHKVYLNTDLGNATRVAHAVAAASGTTLDEVEYEGFQTLLDLGALAESESSGVDTIVADPIGDLHRLLLEEASNKAIRPTMNTRLDVSVHLERWCRRMCEAPVNFVMVAHELVNEPEGDGIPAEIIPFTGTKSGSLTLGKKLAAMVDVIGYTGRLVDEEDQAHYIAQLVPARGRLGGDRFDVLGRVREVNLAEWHALCAASPVAGNNDQTAPAAEEAVAA
jgi:hypothetical protein